MSGLTSKKLAYLAFEPKNGSNANLSPLIFLHGVFASKEHWSDIPQTVANATGRKAYAVDAINHGDSDWRDDYEFENNADDLFNFMDTHNIPKAVLIGHSMGGSTAITAALERPERVEQLIVEDMYVKKVSQALLDFLVGNAVLLQKVCVDIPNNLDEDQSKQFIMTSVLEHVPPEIGEMLKREKNTAKLFALKKKPDGGYTFKANLPVIERALKSKITTAPEPEGLYDGPACFIYGELSPFLVKQEEEHIRTFFPNAEFVGIPGATHSIHSEVPTEFNDALLKFFLRK